MAEQIKPIAESNSFIVLDKYTQEWTGGRERVGGTCPRNFPAESPAGAGCGNGRKPFELEVLMHAVESALAPRDDRE